MDILTTIGLVITIIVGIIAIISAIYKVYDRFSSKEKSDYYAFLELSPEQIKILAEMASNNNSDQDEEPELLIKFPEFPDSFDELPEAVRKNQMRIAMVEYVIEEERENIDTTKFAEALIDLADGSFVKAEKVFAKIKKTEKPTGRRGARIAIVLGEITKHQMHWHDSAKHHIYAVKTYPCSETLIAAQKFFIDIADYNSALAFSTDAKKVASIAYGEKSGEYAIILGNLAEVYQKLGKHEKAALIYLQILDICEETFESQHPLVFIAINSLGIIYTAQGDHKNAELFFEQALTIQKQLIGEDHPDIANIINNLASIYHSQGQDKKAESFFLHAIKIREDALGENNPENAFSFNNLAGMYEKQNRYNEAESCYQKSIKIFETYLAPDHPNIKKVKTNYENFKKNQANQASTEKTTPQ